MPTIISASANPPVILPSRTVVDASADGDLLDAIAARNTFLTQWTDGTTECDSGFIEQVAPPTPRRGYSGSGHDHSGGHMGVPQKHLVWHNEWGWHDGLASYADAPKTTSSAGNGKVIDAPISMIWVPGGVVYKTLSVVAMLYVKTADARDVYVSASNLGTEVSKTEDITAGTLKVVEIAAQLPMRTMSFNTIHFKVDAQDIDPGSEVYLLALMLYQKWNVARPTITP